MRSNLMIVDEEFLFDYRNSGVDKYVLNRLESLDSKFSGDKWLLESEPKRAIFSYIYKPLLTDRYLQQDAKILDIGGGLSTFTRQFLYDFDYGLCELMAHDRGLDFSSFRLSECKGHIIFDDWYNHLIGDCVYDLVIANDIFPNVDQRLDTFLRRARMQTKKLVMLLTWYEGERFYRSDRHDGDEIFFMVPWNKDQIFDCLTRHGVEVDFSFLNKNLESVYPNGRHLAIVEIVF